MKVFKFKKSQTSQFILVGGIAMIVALPALGASRSSSSNRNCATCSQSDNAAPLVNSSVVHFDNISLITQKLLDQENQVTAPSLDLSTTAPNLPGAIPDCTLAQNANDSICHPTMQKGSFWDPVSGHIDTHLWNLMLFGADYSTYTDPQISAILNAMPTFPISPFYSTFPQLIPLLPPPPSTLPTAISA